MAKLGNPAIRTYKTSLPDLSERDAGILRELIEVYNTACRYYLSYHQRVARGKQAPLEAHQIKSDLMYKFGLSSRQANSVLAFTEGKIKSQQELMSLQLKEAQAELKIVFKKIALLNKLRKDCSAQHAKRLKAQGSRSDAKKELKPGVRKLTKYDHDKAGKDLARLYRKRDKLAALVDRLLYEKKHGIVHLTLGGKPLLRERSRIDKIGDAAKRSQALEQWHAKWHAARNSVYQTIGSKDEASGCQGCVSTLEEDGSVSLRIKLTSGLAKKYRDEHGDLKFLVIRNVKLHHGAEYLRYVLAQAELRKAEVAQAKEKAQLESQKYTQADVEAGQAVSWQLIWAGGTQFKANFTLSIPAPKARSSDYAGCVGVDFNNGFLTLSAVDRFGNVLFTKNVTMATYALSQEQRFENMAQAVKEIIEEAAKRQMILAIEDLDFSDLKRDTVRWSRQRKTMVHALAYAQFKGLMARRAYDAGLELRLVNPAFTSVKGLFVYQERKGFTAHQGAASVIARTSLGYEERAPSPGKYHFLVGTLSVELSIPEGRPRDIEKSLDGKWRRAHSILRSAIESQVHCRKLARTAQAAQARAVASLSKAKSCQRLS